MKYSVHATKIRLDWCNDEKIFVSDEIHAKIPQIPYYEKTKFLGKGAKFHA